MDLTPGPERDAVLRDMDALREARKWARVHGHQPPDDRMFAAYGSKIYDLAYRAGQEDVAKAIEQPDSPLCDCRVESTPTNWQTKAAMDHHCDCPAVRAAALMLGAYSKTVHARQCGHGTEMDEFYLPRTPGEDVTPKPPADTSWIKLEEPEPSWYERFNDWIIRRTR